MPHRCGMIVWLAFVVAMLVFGGGAAQAAECSSADIGRASERVDTAQKNMAALPAQDMVTDISPEAQRAIAALKAGLGDLVSAYMRCAPSEPDPKRIEQELLGLARGGAPVKPATEEVDPGDVQFEARTSPGKPALIGITADFPVQCGSDAVLSVFAPDGASWGEVLRWQSKPYAQVSGAFGSFEYAISSRDRSGGWYVVAKSVAPWCTSTWSVIRYTTMRSGADAAEPKILHAAEHSIWWGNDDFGRLTVNEADFYLRFHTSSLDIDAHNREWLGHFSVVGDSVRRVQPVAASPRDFVDEWIASPWTEAIHWSDAGGDTVLQTWHETLNKKRSLGFQAVRLCPTGRANHYQIELQADDDEQHYYFYVVGAGYYILTRISRTADCSGDIIPEVARDVAKTPPPAAPADAETRAQRAIERAEMRPKPRPLRHKGRMPRSLGSASGTCDPEREEICAPMAPMPLPDYSGNTTPFCGERRPLHDFFRQFLRDCE